MLFHTFSDASFKGKTAGFGIVIAHETPLGIQQIECIHGTLEVESNIHAELAATIRALREVPAKSLGYCWSDLSGISHIVYGKSRWAKRNQELVDQLRGELYRSGLRLMYSNSGKHYKNCHSMACQAAGRTGKRKEKYTKPKVKKWWTIRPG